MADTSRQDKKSAEIFKALASDARLKILRLLKDGDLCVKALAGELGISDPSVCRHLTVLSNLGAVVPEKKGYYVHYRLNRKTLVRWESLAGEILGKAEGSETAGKKSKRRNPTCAKIRNARNRKTSKASRGNARKSR